VWRPLIGFDALGIFLAPILITSVAYSARREREGKKKRHYYAHQLQPPGGVRAPAYPRVSHIRTRLQESGRCPSDRNSATRLLPLP
jgi:hypothetical protein